MTTAGPQNAMHAMVFVRNWLKQLIDSLSDEQMLHQPVPGGNHALWIIGHLAWCDDLFWSQIGGFESTSPAEWKGIFGDGSTPSANASDYPPIDEMKRTFDRNRETLLGWLDGFDDAKLAEPLPDDWKSFAPTYEALIATMAAHEGVHIGQATVIRKSLGMKPAIG